MKAAAAVASLALASCGTLFVRGIADIPVDSDPQGATVTYDGDQVGRTPCVVSMPRRKPRTFELQLAGFAPQKVEVPTEFNAVCLLDVLPIGLLGAGLVPTIVDLFSGSFEQPVEAPVLVTMQPVPTSGQ